MPLFALLFTLSVVEGFAFPARAEEPRFYLLDKSGVDIWAGLAVKREFINIGSEIGDVAHDLCLVPPLADWMEDATAGRLAPLKPDAAYSSQYHALYSAAQVQDQYLNLVDRIFYQAGLEDKSLETLQDLWLHRCVKQTEAPFEGRYRSFGRARLDAVAAMGRTLREFYLSGKASEEQTRRAVLAVKALPRKDALRFAPELEALLTARSAGKKALTAALVTLTAIRPDPATGRLAGAFLDEKDKVLALAAYDAVERIVLRGNGEALREFARPIYVNGDGYPDKSELKLAALNAFNAYPEDIRCAISPCLKKLNRSLTQLEKKFSER